MEPLEGEDAQLLAYRQRVEEEKRKMDEQEALLKAERERFEQLKQDEEIRKAKTVLGLDEEIKPTAARRSSVLAGNVSFGHYEKFEYSSNPGAKARELSAKERLEAKARRASVAVFVPEDCKKALNIAKTHYLKKARVERAEEKKAIAEAKWAKEYNKR